MPSNLAVLGDEESAEFSRLEAVIEKGLPTFADVGTALETIRDSKLYRATDRSFEAYCGRRWGFSRQRGYQLIDAASESKKCQQLLTDCTHLNTESHAREIAKVADEHKAKVIKAASEAVKGKPVTAASLKAARQALAEPAPVHPWHAVAEKWADALRAVDALQGQVKELACSMYGRSLARMLGNKNDKPYSMELSSLRGMVKLCAPTDCPRCKAKGCKMCGDKGWVNVQYAKTLGDEAK